MGEWDTEALAMAPVALLRRAPPPRGVLGDLAKALGQNPPGAQTGRGWEVRWGEACI